MPSWSGIRGHKTGIRDRSTAIGSGIKISKNLGIRDQNFEKSLNQGSKFGNILGSGIKLSKNFGIGDQMSGRKDYQGYQYHSMNPSLWPWSPSLKYSYPAKKRAEKCLFFTFYQGRMPPPPPPKQNRQEVKKKMKIKIVFRADILKGFSELYQHK